MKFSSPLNTVHIFHMQSCFESTCGISVASYKYNFKMFTYVVLQQKTRKVY
jgi:hypothetical protein